LREGVVEAARDDVQNATLPGRAWPRKSVVR
jgi:hypothetical protein